ncbi:MAG: homoserine dehydrogenase [Anaerolineaceae bacterium]|nr:homoserine dehydrogenase [Anaerolineaceae bacterium]
MKKRYARMKIALIGFGNVGQGLAQILCDKAETLRAADGFVPQIVAVATRRQGTLYHPAGLNLELLLAAAAQGQLSAYPDMEGLHRNWAVPEIIRQSNADVVIEVTPTNLQTAHPALDYCYLALEHGKHLVLANKGPVVLAYHELMRRARQAGKQVRFEATVMAGTPALRTGAQNLAGCYIFAMRGILNGTTNYMLSQMENGASYADALAQAQNLGYAETDPRGDVEGWDTAAKAIILAQSLFNANLTIDQLEVEGITGLTTADMLDAHRAGERWKLIAQITPTGGSVRPVRVPLADPLAHVSGAINAITYTTDLLGEVTLVGPGAGQLTTGFGLLSDLLDIHRTASS